VVEDEDGFGQDGALRKSGSQRRAKVASGLGAVDRTMLREAHLW
jgi:hypothetical protein